MIEIRTSGGVSLDLTPDMEFELIMDNPLLDDEHIPTPFSTSIAFPASPRNREVFGYVDTLMLRPSALKIGVTIFVSGIPIVSGTLVYDGVDENKNICYAFKGVDYTEQWEGKIYEIENLLTGSYNITDIKMGLFEDVKAPVMIVRGYEAKTTQELSKSGERDILAATPKYYNTGRSTEMFIPAVSLSLLTRRILGESAAVPLLGVIDGLFIVAPHRDNENTATVSPAIESYLPDISKSDFIKEVCKLSASYVFKDGENVRIISAKDIFESAEYLDWGNLVSDIYSQHLEEAEGYQFGFQEQAVSGTGIAEGGEDGADQSIQSADSLLELLTKPDEEAYKPFRFTKTGDIFSEKKETFDYTYSRPGQQPATVTYAEVLSDKILDSAKNIDMGGESQKNNTIQLQRIYCIPHEKLDIVIGGNPLTGGSVRPGNAYYYRYPLVMPIVSMPEINADRTATAYIGAIINNQLCDKGIAFAANSTDDYEDSSKSLVPERYYQLYHRELAEWFGKTRQTIKADLNLSAADIASFRMWQKVLIKHRPFLVKQLSIRFSAGAGVAFSTGEFISL